MDYFEAILARWEQEWVDGPIERKRKIRDEEDIKEPDEDD